ncbi:MAG: hypothetical protein EOM54_04415 [Clostridia bacterium]|nr:hypothetical protein [Clostridia bacterium]
MEIHVNAKNHIVEFWLTNAEKNDALLRESLKSQYKKWKAENYLPVMYESGERDLYKATSDLLRYNRRRIAQLEVQSEKRRSAEINRQ